MTEQEKETQMDMEEEIISEEINENQEVEEQTEESDERTQLKKTVEDLEGRLLRTMADFENYKKRARAEKEDFAKYANLKLISELLPIYDNLERAINSSHESKNFESLIQGVEMVYRQLEEMMKKEGLEEIEAVGQPFNPEYHQAVMQIESDEYESGMVVEEFQKGYKLKEKVIRPSMVKVNA